MPNPTLADVHVNRLMTSMSVAFMQSPNGFVATKVFPIIGNDKKSDRYAVYNSGDFMRDQMQIRGPGAESAGGGWRVSTDTFSTDVWAFHVDIDNQTDANTDAPFNLERDAAIFLAQIDLVRKERAWASEFFTTGKWTGAASGSDLVGGTDFGQWDDVSSSPIEFFDEQVAAVESATGQTLNTLVLNRRGFNALKEHPDIVDRVKHTSRDSVTMQIIANLIGIDRIMIGTAVANTAQEGLADDIDYIFGNHALLLYVPPAPGLFVPSAGYTFVWTALNNGASMDGVSISTFPLEWRKVNRHEIESAWDMKQIGANLGVFMSNVIS